MTRFDQLILRPILIHKYEKDKESRAKDFYEMFTHEGNEMKKFYQNEQRRTSVNFGSRVSDKTAGDSSKNMFLRSATMMDNARHSGHSKRQKGSDHGSNSSKPKLISTTINERNADDEDQKWQKYFSFVYQGVFYPKSS